MNFNLSLWNSVLVATTQARLSAAGASGRQVEEGNDKIDWTFFSSIWEKVLFVRDDACTHLATATFFRFRKMVGVHGALDIRAKSMALAMLCSRHVSE